MRTGTSREPWWSLHSEEIEIERRLAASLSSLHDTAPHLPALATRLDECVPVVRRIAAQLKRGQAVDGPGPLRWDSDLWKLPCRPRRSCACIRLTGGASPSATLLRRGSDQGLEAA